MDRPLTRHVDFRLIAYVALGVLLGGIYTLFDILSESRIRSGTLTGTLASAHAVIDHAAPMLVGARLGVCAHYFRLRAQLSAANQAASRAEALRIRLQKLERDQAVWVLAAAVLHELNNPLHALGLLLDEATGQGDDSERADLMQRARAQADRALLQLRALRSMRGIGEPECQQLALNRVVAALVEEVGSLAGENGLVVKVESQCEVRASADPVYFRTILESLVDNSLHSLRESGGGCIRIQLSIEHDRAVVCVSDNGPPLDPRVRSTLFEPLRTTKTQGLGLGLPIARALARAMRGDLSFDDIEEKSFRLELPLGDAS